MAVILDTASKSSAADAHLHFMPCKISHNGPALVDKYFESSVRPLDKEKCEDKLFTSSYRGRPLVGCEVKVPNGYTGCVVKETRRPYDEEEERNVKITHKFSSFNYWNLDCHPSANDKFQQAMAWLDISKTVHSPMKEQPSEK